MVTQKHFNLLLLLALGFTFSYGSEGPTSGVSVNEVVNSTQSTVEKRDVKDKPLKSSRDIACENAIKNVQNGANTFREEIDYLNKTACIGNLLFLFPSMVKYPFGNPENDDSYVNVKNKHTFTTQEKQRVTNSITGADKNARESIIGNLRNGLFFGVAAFGMWNTKGWGLYRADSTELKWVTGFLAYEAAEHVATGCKQIYERNVYKKKCKEASIDDLN